MPKVKHITADPLKDLLLKTIRDDGIKYEVLALKMAITRMTLHDWLFNRDTADWRVRDLKQLCQILGIPWAEVRELL